MYPHERDFFHLFEILLKNIWRLLKYIHVCLENKIPLISSTYPSNIKDTLLVFTNYIYLWNNFLDDQYKKRREVLVPLTYQGFRLLFPIIFEILNSCLFFVDILFEEFFHTFLINDLGIKYINCLKWILWPTHKGRKKNHSNSWECLTTPLKTYFFFIFNLIKIWPHLKLIILFKFYYNFLILSKIYI